MVGKVSLYVYLSTFCPHFHPLIHIEPAPFERKELAVDIANEK